MPTPSAHIHEVACAAVAPSACAAAKTITTELVKPTSTADFEGVAKTDEIPHGGELRWEGGRQSAEYRVILDWILGAREGP